MAERTRQKSDISYSRDWSTQAGLILLRAVSVLPWPALAVLGAIVGVAFRIVSARRRRTALTNIARCFPAMSSREQTRLVRMHFRALGQAFLATGIAWWGSARRLRGVVRLVNEHHLEQALAAQRSVVLLAPHFVGLEIGGIRVSVDWPMVTMFAEAANPVIARQMSDARLRFHMQLIAGHQAPLMRMVRALTAGVPLYYLPDQDAGRTHSVFAPFYGIPAATYTTLARLARMSNALVIPCATYLRDHGRGFETVFHAPLDDFPSGDVLADATRMNQVIERLIQVHPAQYQWCYKRFKTRPPGEPKFY